MSTEPSFNSLTWKKQSAATPPRTGCWSLGSAPHNTRNHSTSMGISSRNLATGLQQNQGRNISKITTVFDSSQDLTAGTILKFKVQLIPKSWEIIKKQSWSSMMNQPSIHRRGPDKPGCWQRHSNSIQKTVVSCYTYLTSFWRWLVVSS